MYEINTPLVIEEVGINKPGPNQVSIRTLAAGLCHSVLHVIDRSLSRPLPAITGHASASVVEQVGSAVTYVRPGDTVITCLAVICGTCDRCTEVRPALCFNPDVKKPPGVSDCFTWSRPEKLHQVSNLSSFTEQMLVHENAVVKIDKEMTPELAALISCAVMTVYGAVVNTAGNQGRRHGHHHRPRRSRHGRQEVALNFGCSPVGRELLRLPQFTSASGTTALSLICHQTVVSRSSHRSFCNLRRQRHHRPRPLAAVSRQMSNLSAISIALPPVALEPAGGSISARAEEPHVAGDSPNSARAVGFHNEPGTFEAGKWADLAVCDIETPAELIYRMGYNPLHKRVWRDRDE